MGRRASLDSWMAWRKCEDAVRGGGGRCHHSGAGGRLLVACIGGIGGARVLPGTRGCPGTNNLKSTTCHALLYVPLHHASGCVCVRASVPRGRAHSAAEQRLCWQACRRLVPSKHPHLLYCVKIDVHSFPDVASLHATMLRAQSITMPSGVTKAHRVELLFTTVVSGAEWGRSSCESKWCKCK